MSGTSGPGRREEPVAPRGPPGRPGPTEAEVLDALRAVIDPELGLDVVTLGLVYRVEISAGAVRITYSLTTPGCPLEGIVTEGLRQAAEGVPGVERVETNLVWEPAWHPGMIREGAW